MERCEDHGGEQGEGRVSAWGAHVVTNTGRSGDRTGSGHRGS